MGIVFWWDNRPWGFRFAPILQSNDENVHPRGHRISFQRVVGGIHRSETTSFDMGLQFAFNQNGRGANEPRKPKFDCRPSMKFLKEEDMAEMRKSFSKWLALCDLNFRKLTKPLRLHIYGPENPQSFWISKNSHLSQQLAVLPNVFLSHYDGLYTWLRK